MKVTIKYDLKDFRKEVMKAVDEAAIETLSNVCELAISNILDIHDWQNQTGCMESSVGGVVAKRGHVVRTFGFKVVLNGAEGAEKGRNYAISLAEHNDSDYCCYVVVGVDYASYVEAKGRDIISSTDLWVRGQADLIKEDIANMIKDNVD